MRVRRISALGLVTFAVVVHAGCDAPRCPPNSAGPYDNRDRTQFPNTDQDWICLKDPEIVPPPVAPNVTEDKPASPANLRDREAVARAAIFIQSCKPDFLFSGFNINTQIEATYNAVMRSPYEQAMLDRVNCFRWKINACEALRECVGIAVTPMEPAFAPGCDKLVAMRRVGVPPAPVHDVWMDCGINTHRYFHDEFQLKCHTNPEAFCAGPVEKCPMETLEPYCDKSYPRQCEISSDTGALLSYGHMGCFLAGMTCAMHDNFAACTGSGQACDARLPANGEYLRDFRAGIACDDNKTLRACVNGHEDTLDCTSVGVGIKCIGGSRPHCGADFQCNYDGSNPLPTCEGTLIHVCNAGVPMTFDCAKLGFETCDPERGVCKPKQVDPEE